jgi:hypothetical protein
MTVAAGPVLQERGRALRDRQGGGEESAVGAPSREEGGAAIRAKGGEKEREMGGERKELETLTLVCIDILVTGLLGLASVNIFCKVVIKTALVNNK